MGGAATAHLHLGRLAGVAAVFDVDALDRHLRAARLLHDHPRTVVQVVTATVGTARTRVANPFDPAGIAREADRAVVERSTAQIVVASALGADDVEGHDGHPTTRRWRHTSSRLAESS